MTSDARPPTSFLSLPEELVDLLPSYVVSGEGGLQALLNFRRVCTETQRSVDELPECLGKLIFSKGGVFMRTEEIQKFVLTPPPFPLSSLKLHGQYDCFHVDGNLWNYFVSFWSTRLESLEIDVLQLPLNARLLQLLSSPLLKKLSCTYVRHSERPATATGAADPLAEPFAFPGILMRLEDLTFLKFGMTNDEKHFFLSRLSTSQNLKRLCVQMNCNASVDAIRIIVDTRTDDKEFQLAIIHDLFLPEQLDLLYVRLVNSVAVSSSQIRILNLYENKVIGLQERVGEIVARKFFDCIEVISKMTNGVARLTDYPNLKVLHSLRVTLPTLAGVEFPQRLQQIGITGFVRDIPNLPRSLTHLSLTGYTCTVDELLESLNALSGMCRLLQKLTIGWTSTQIKNVSSKGAARNVERANDNEKRFPQLRSLDFNGTYEDEEDPLAANRVILLEGFQLPQLTLTELDLKCEFITTTGCLQPMLDSNTLDPIAKGVVANTLRDVNIDHFSVTEEAQPLLATLRSTAAAIKAKRRQTHGVK